MTYADPLAAIAAADLAPRAASAIVRRVLTEDPRAGDRVYRALRAWCWKALTERRYDEELRLWFDLMCKTAAALSARRQKTTADKISALGDLVYESIQFGEDDPIEDQLARAHVRVILTCLSPSAHMDKRTLMERTQLRQANLWRIMGGLISSGLVDRQSRGKEAVYRLTRRGVDAAALLPRSSDRTQVPVSRGRALNVLRAIALRRERLLAAAGPDAQTYQIKTPAFGFDDGDFNPSLASYVSQPRALKWSREIVASISALRPSEMSPNPNMLPIVPAPPSAPPGVPLPSPPIAKSYREFADAA